MSFYKKNFNISALLLFFLFTPIVGVKVLVTFKIWMLLCALTFLFNINKNKKLTINDSYLLVLIYFLGIFVSLILNFNNAEIYSVSFLLSILMFLLLLYTLDMHILSFRDFRNDFSVFLKYYVSLTLIYALLGYAYAHYNVTAYDTVYYGVFIQHGFPRLSGFVDDPNIAAFYFSVLICFCRILSIKSRYIFLLIILILLTGSRTSLAFLFVYFLFLSFNNKKIMLLVVCLILITLLLHHFSFFELPNIFRINDVDSMSRLGGRAELWDKVIEYMLINPLSINGFGTSRLFLVNLKGAEVFFHNTFLELIYELGLVFTTFFVSIILYIILNFKILILDKILLCAVYLIYPISLSLSINEVFFSSVFILSLLKSRRHEVH